MKGLAFRAFKREGAATSGVDDVDDELGAFSGAVLRLADVKPAAADVAQVHTTAADGDFARQVTVGGAAVTTPAGLVKHDGAMFAFEQFDKFQRRCGRYDFFNHAVSNQKRGSKLPPLCMNHAGNDLDLGMQKLLIYRCHAGHEEPAPDHDPGGHP